ncbi:DUF2391 family protein [Patescibacteria group bacterium]|nr:DUF2391 family protein [Patescibacteria group bacterium]
MPDKTKEPNTDQTPIDSISNTIKNVISLPAEVGQAVRKEISEFLLKATTPLRTEFRPKDLLQVIIGASILAVPVGFTEEVWNLGGTLPTKNIVILAIISLVFIGAFVYYSYYRRKFMRHIGEYIKRVLSTYFFSLVVVAVLLTIIEVTPWSTDLVLAIKRVILVSFPASMSAVVADTIK